jgi:predicted nucleic acid-binding protein
MIIITNPIKLTLPLNNTLYYAKYIALAENLELALPLGLHRLYQAIKAKKLF